MDNNNKNLGGYKGTGQYGTFDGIEYKAPDAQNPYGSVVKPVKPITDASTVGTQQPIKLPQQKAPIADMNLESSIMGSTQAIKTKAQQEADLAKETIKKDTNAITTLMEQIGGIGQEREKLYKEGGVDVEKQKVDEYTSQIEAEQNALTRKIQQIQKNPTGMYAGSVEDEVRRVTNESLAKQADLSILQNVALRRYDTASSIAERAVQAKLEPMKTRLDYLTFIYENNKDLFNKADAERLKEEERKIKTEEERLTKGNEIIINAIKSKAPQSLISKAKEALSKGGAIADVVSLLGNYSMSPAERMELELKGPQIDKERKELGGSGVLKNLDTTEFSKFTANPNYKSVQDGGKFYKALDDFKKATEKWGTAERISAEGRGELNATYKALTGLTKDYYTLGTLDAGVEKLISMGIPKPGTYRIRDKVVLSSVEKEKEQVLNSIKNSANQLSNSIYGNSVELQSLLKESLPSEGSATTEDEYTNTILNSTVASPFSTLNQ